MSDAQLQQNLLEMLAEIKIDYRTAVRNQVTFLAINEALSTQNAGAVSALQIVANISELVEDKASSHNDDVDLIVENIWNDDWAVKRGYDALGMSRTK